jgi:hypothetical protein
MIKSDILKGYIQYRPIKTKNSVACSPQANYTDRAAAAC